MEKPEKNQKHETEIAIRNKAKILNDESMILTIVSYNFRKGLDFVAKEVHYHHECKRKKKDKKDKSNNTPFFYKQSNFDPRPENCLSFSKKLPQKIIKQLLSRFFSPLMYNHTTSSRLYYKYLQNLQRLHAKYAQSAKTAELNLRNTARKTLDKSAMLALSPKPNMFVC